MKPKWVSSSLSSLLASYKARFHQHPSPSSWKASAFVLNHVDVSLLLSQCGREGNLHLGSSLHASIIKTHDFTDQQQQDCYSARNSIVVCNSLLSLYSKCGVLSDAVKVFDEMPLRDTISWNTLISGYLSTGEFESGLGWFKNMQRLGLCSFDQATLTTVLSAFEQPELGYYVNRMIHGLVFVSGFDGDISVGNALVTSYFKCGSSLAGKQVFDEMLERNVISWTAAISGLSQNELYEDSLRLTVGMLAGGAVEPNFLTYLSALMACSGLQAVREGTQVHAHLWKLGIESELCIESALMDMYSKCGSVEDSWRIFDSAKQLDEVSMTVILVGFAQNGFEQEALQFFTRMVRSGAEVDANVVSAALGAFDADAASSSSLGQQIHSMIIKRNFDTNAFVCNGLINMYSKCGDDLDESIKIFNHMPSKNSVSWNSMIAAATRHGHFSRALQLYHEMKQQEEERVVEPTDVTFLSLLHACSHGGFLDEGMNLLESMTQSHNIIPRTEHYACVVDMLGRAGLLNEAKAFIDRLPIEPDVLIWQALLGACGIHGDAEMGKFAAEKLFLCAPNEPGPYVLLANIYSSNKRWKERATTIRRMKEMGVGKETGMSWIEVDRKVHSFVVEDRMHGEGKGIYGVIMELFGNMVDEGYVPDKRFLLHYVDPNGR